MRSYSLPLAIIGLLSILSSCASQPGSSTSPTSTSTTSTTSSTSTTSTTTTTTTMPVAQIDSSTNTQAPSAAKFDPAAVSAEVKTATFSDAKALIERLNTIIQTKNIEQWLGYLTEEYTSYYSNPQVLSNLSESSVLKRLGVKLKSINDYFLYVVYPSRQNARLDDIDFLGADRIVALTLSPKGERLVLYYLEKKNDSWKIGIGR